MGFIISLVALFVLIASWRFLSTRDLSNADPEVKTAQKIGSWAIIAACAIPIWGVGSSIAKTVPAGHVYVPVLFGKVQENELNPGLNIVNPFLEFEPYDTRDKTHKETALVPAQDKLFTTMDVSVQYRVIGSAASDMLQNTGTAADAITVHLQPKLRSILREQGKSIEQSQDFFKDEVQAQLQENLKESLVEFLTPKGILVDQVLLRNIQLPPIINQAIEETKTREQQIIKQQAELDRFAKEQEQKVATAQAEYDAAKLEAKKVRELKDAEAYGIAVVTKQLDRSPQYVELVKAEKWDGKLPIYAGGENTPMIDLRK